MNLDTVVKKGKALLRTFQENKDLRLLFLVVLFMFVLAIVL